jgi:hypothetical protein
MADFDRLKLHTFPGASRKPADIWPAAQDAVQFREPSPLIVQALKGQEDCGVLASTLENMAISASFVGAAAGAIVVGEVLRALHGGCRCELLHLQLRALQNRRLALHADKYRSAMAQTGFVSVVISLARVPTEGCLVPPTDGACPIDVDDAAGLAITEALGR